MINRLLTKTRKKHPRSLSSIFSTLIKNRFVVLFCIGFIASLLFSLIFSSNSIADSGTNNNTFSELISQITLLKNSTRRLIETIGLFVGGIIFCIVLDRWFSQRSNPNDNTPLAQQAKRLKQLKIGYPEGMTNLEVLREQRLLERRFGVYSRADQVSFFGRGASRVADPL